MPCVLTKIGPAYFSAKTGSVVTIAIQKTTLQKLGAATCNGTKCPITNDLSTKFTVVAGDAALDLAIVGHGDLSEDLNVVEVCGDTTQYLYGYEDDYESDIKLYIKGVA
jgi:hypothetical protein